jgi:hypothetical protein
MLTFFRGEMSWAGIPERWFCIHLFYLCFSILPFRGIAGLETRYALAAWLEPGGRTPIKPIGIRRVDLLPFVPKHVDGLLFSYIEAVGQTVFAWEIYNSVASVAQESLPAGNRCL